MSFDEPQDIKKNVDLKEDEGLRSDDPIKPIQLKASDGINLSVKSDELVSKITGKFETWESWRKPYESLWEEIYQLYIGTVKSTKTSTRAKVFIPITFQVIEAAMPKIMNLIFNTEEFFDVVPLNAADAPLGAVIKKLLLYQLGRANFFFKFFSFAKQLFMYGTSYMKVFWIVKRKWVWTRTPVRKDVTLFGFKIGSRIVKWEEEKKFTVTERRPEIEFVDIIDVYPDPSAIDEQGGSGVFIRSWMTPEEIKEMGRGKFPVYANTGNEDIKGGQTFMNTVRTVRSTSRGVHEPLAFTKDKVEVLEFWGTMDLDEDGIREEVLITIANRKVLLAAKPNPFHHQKRPLVRSILFLVPGEWYGMGLVEPIIGLHHELNTLRRQRLDNVNLILNRMWKVNSLADVDIETLVSTPNGIIITDDMNAVEALATPDVTQSAYNDASIVQSDIENVTTPRSTQGIPESGRLGRTARGAQLIIGQALEKFGLIAKLSEELAIKKILRFFQQLNLQFIDDDQVLQAPDLYGHLFENKITPEMIRAEVDFKMLGISDLTAKEAQINQIISFFGVFKNMLSAETITLMARKTWKLMGFNEAEVNQVQAQLPEPGAVIPDAQADQNNAASITGQVAQNGATAPPSIPVQ